MADKGMELGHIVSEECARRLIGHLSRFIDEAVLELDIGLGRIHLRRIEEGENGAQMLLSDRRAYLSRRSADHRRRLAGKHILPVGTARPVDRILQRTWNGAVIFGRYEKHGIDACNVPLERLSDFRKIRVVVVAVERQAL